MSVLIDPVVTTRCREATFRCTSAASIRWEWDGSLRSLEERRLGVLTRVERGSAGYGSYGADSGDSIGARRDAEPPDARFCVVGFRICLSRSRATTGEV
jgi:hypothetical protein